MLLNIKVVPNAKKVKIIKENDLLKVYMKSPPVKGRANRELIEVLSEHFKVRKGSIRIIKGERFTRKVIKIM